MHLKLMYDGVGAADHGAIQDALKQWAREHLEPLLEGIGLQQGELSAGVARRAGGDNAYVVRLRMHLPRKRIVVASAGDADANRALHQAQDRLRRQVERHIERLRHQSAYKRRARRLRLRELKRRAAELPVDVLQQADTGIEPLLPRLERVVRRELAYLRDSGDLSSDYPSVQDVIDEAVAGVKADWRNVASGEGLLQRLLNEAFRAMDREAEASRRYGETVSLEAAPPDDADDQAEAMIEEEFQEYYQPDEALRLSDVLPDTAARVPESMLDDTQQAFILETMRGLPALWRRALMLRELERLEESDIGAILEVDLAQVEAWLTRARAFLLAHLRQAGFAVNDEQSIAGRLGE